MTESLPEPKTIQDAYQLLEVIGRGGMAIVYKARQNSLDRMVALKEIKPVYAANPELRERFKREATTAAALVHENIVQVYNFGEPPAGSLFIVMEYVRGKDLKTLLAASGAVPPRVGAIIVREVASALAYAHARGLIHRDVKPGNVMISGQGEVKLMDFGIVREMDSDLTKTGAFLGTPNYMSPEQFLAEELTPASDLFSLGVVAYEILAGEKPFRADSEASLSKKVRSEKEAPVRSWNPEVPRRLQAIVHHCLVKDPRRRLGDAEELTRLLDKFLHSRSRFADRAELANWLHQVLKLDDQTSGSAVSIPKAAAEPISARPAAAAAPDFNSRIIHDRPPAPEPSPAARKWESPPVTRPEPPPERLTSSKAAEPPPKAIPARVLTRTAEPAPEKTLPDRTADLDESVADQTTGSRTSLGEWSLRWLWRLILLAIAIIAAAIVFVLVNPGPQTPPSGPRSTIERFLDRLH